MFESKSRITCPRFLQPFALVLGVVTSNHVLLNVLRLWKLHGVVHCWNTRNCHHKDVYEPVMYWASEIFTTFWTRESPAPVVQHNGVSTMICSIVWKPTNLRESIWKELYMTILQERESIHWNITILCTNLFLCLKQWKYLKQKQQWTKNGEKLEQNTSLATDESQKQKWGVRWSKE